MPTFSLTAHVTVSTYTEVEADTLEQAIEIAGSRSVELHFNGSGNSPEDVWCVDEIDGELENIRGG